MEKFYNEIQPVFERLKQPIPEFIYNEDTKEYIAIDGYTKDNYDYTIIVREDGQVVYGMVEGNKFYEEDTLGYI